MPPELDWFAILATAVREAVQGQIANAYRDGYRDGANRYAGGTRGYDPARAYADANERAAYYSIYGESPE